MLQHEKAPVEESGNTGKGRPFENGVPPSSLRPFPHRPKRFWRRGRDEIFLYNILFLLIILL
ncbi:hypothetical protein WCP94_002867 [Bilophila wadsworthia]